MSIPWSTSKWMLFLAIMLFALPGMDLWAELPPAMDIPTGYPRQSSVCASNIPVTLSSISSGYLAADRQSLYGFTQGDPNTVVKISKKDGRLQTLASLGARPSSVLADHRSIFWVEETTPSDGRLTFMKVDKRGRKLTELWQGPGAIEYLNMGRRNLYWFDYTADILYRMPKKGGEPKVFVSGLQGFANFAIIAGRIFLGGHEGLYILERPSQTPRLLISSEQLLRDLHIGLRDERSIYYAGPVIAEYNDEIIFQFYVANNPGMVSCSDNADYIVALPRAGGTPRILLTLPGYSNDTDLFAPYLYSTGVCRGGQMINLDTGKTSMTNLGASTSALVVDKRYIYWSGYYQDLQCMRRPTE